jgi:hypothetical protein
MRAIEAASRWRNGNPDEEVKMNKKLDPGLRSKLRATRDQTKSRRAPSLQTSLAGGQRIGIIVEFTGNLDDLTALGFERHTLVQHPTKGYKIATGVIPLDRLDDLAAIDHVVEIEGPRRMHPELNYSLPEIHATAVHVGNPSRKGDGVVIGIVDSGVCFNLPSSEDPSLWPSDHIGVWADLEFGG